MSEFAKLKEDIKNVPTFVWWVGAGAVGVLFVVKRMGVGSSAASTATSSPTVANAVPTDSLTPGGSVMASGNSTSDSTGTNMLLQQLVDSQNANNKVTGAATVPVTATVTTAPGVTPPITATKTGTTKAPTVTPAATPAPVTKAKVGTGGGEIEDFQHNLYGGPAWMKNPYGMRQTEQ
jgi:hypothetical protein